MTFPEQSVDKEFKQFLMEKGNVFIFNNVLRGVPDGEVRELALENTASDDGNEVDPRYLIVEKFEAAVEGQSTIENIDASIDSEGTVLSVNNLNTGSSNGNDISRVLSGPGYTVNESFGEQLVGISAGRNSAGGDEKGHAAIIAPGDAIVGKLTNESGSSEDVGIRVVYYEVPERLMEEQP